MSSVRTSSLPALAFLLVVPVSLSAQQPGKGDFTAYRQAIGDSGVGFDMVPIAGGTFTMGSPAGEAGRKDDEGPQVEVAVAPFWMAKCEVTWPFFGKHL